MYRCTYVGQLCNLKIKQGNKVKDHFGDLVSFC